VTLSLKLTNTTTIADLRRLIEPLAPSAIRETVPGRRHETEPKPVHPLPAGMTAWVSANDVARALSCSHAKAHEHLRAAAGRAIGTGHLLRVPVDIWETWARDTLIDGPRNVRRRAPSGGRPNSTTDGQLTGTSSKPKRRKLGPYSDVVSKMPLIPTLKYVKV
jgi:hypothetical protein